MSIAKKIGVISLGCDKNRVDTEKMLSFLTNYEIVTEQEDAQVLIINTCAFLSSSREEALNEIIKAGQLKENGSLEKIIVTGCLPQKFISEIFDELPEVDGFLGISDYNKIASVIEQTYSGQRVNAVGCPGGEPTINRVKTTNGYAYLKIADGCDNHCTYCLIPSIRGKFRSVPTCQLIEETRLLGKTNELILVAQDLCAYGKDLNDGSSLVSLIQELSKLDNVDKIRLLYCYPENLTDQLVEEIATNDKVIKYVDMPLQHADDKVLKLMNRRGTGAQYLNLIEKLKSKVPNIAIRSTFITGFPGESEQAFKNLKEFLKKAKLFNVGFFKYSREQGTPAYKLKEQVLERVKNKRLKELYDLSYELAQENLSALIGKTFSVTAEGFDNDALTYFGRAYFNAPDIDGKIYFFSQHEVEVGKEYQVKIIESEGYDLYGERL